MAALVSIIIPTQAPRRESLFRLLQSIRSQEFQFEFEIIVVFNPPSIKIADELSKLCMKELKVLSSRPGVNLARNLGIEYATGEWLYFLDDDVVLKNTQHFRNIRYLFETAPQAEVWGGGYEIYPRENCSVMEIAYQLNADFGFRRNRSIERRRFLGGNLLVQRKRVGKIRFDEKIDFGGSEERFVNEICKNSITFYSKLLDVLHDLRGSFSGLTRKVVLQGRTASRLKLEKNSWPIDLEFWSYIRPRVSSLPRCIQIFVARDLLRFYFSCSKVSMALRHLLLFVYPVSRAVALAEIALYRLCRWTYFVFWRSLVPMAWQTATRLLKPYYFIRFQLTHSSSFFRKVLDKFFFSLKKQETEITTR